MQIISDEVSARLTFNVSSLDEQRQKPIGMHLFLKDTLLMTSY